MVGNKRTASFFASGEPKVGFVKFFILLLYAVNSMSKDTFVNAELCMLILYIMIKRNPIQLELLNPIYSPYSFKKRVIY